MIALEAYIEGRVQTPNANEVPAVGDSIPISDLQFVSKRVQVPGRQKNFAYDATTKLSAWASEDWPNGH